MNEKRFTNIMLVVVMMTLATTVGCSVSNQQAAGQESTPKPVSELSPTELKYRLREEFDDEIHYCGPPVVVSSIDPSKRFEQFSVIAQKTEEFQTILRHNSLTVTGPWSDQDKQTVIQEHNTLSAIRLEPVGKKYEFHLLVPNIDTSGFTEEPTEQTSPQLPKNMLSIEGFIDQNGIISVSKKEPIFHTCPR